MQWRRHSQGVILLTIISVLVLTDGPRSPHHWHQKGIYPAPIIGSHLFWDAAAATPSLWNIFFRVGRNWGESIQKDFVSIWIPDGSRRNDKRNHLSLSLWQCKENKEKMEAEMPYFTLLLLLSLPRRLTNAFHKGRFQVLLSIPFCVWEFFNLESMTYVVYQW